MVSDDDQKELVRLYRKLPRHLAMLGGPDATRMVGYFNEKPDELLAELSEVVRQRRQAATEAAHTTDVDPSLSNCEWELSRVRLLHAAVATRKLLVEFTFTARFVHGNEMPLEDIIKLIEGKDG